MGWYRIIGSRVSLLEDNHFWLMMGFWGRVLWVIWWRVLGRV